MGGLFERLSQALAQGHQRAIPDLLTDARFAEAGRMAEAAVLIAVTDRPVLKQRSDRTDQPVLKQRSDRADEQGPTVILTQRPTTMRDHPGQVAFPGGKLDPGEDAIAAALREAEEELAIAPDQVRIVGTTDRYFTGTGFAITPVLGVIPPDLAITPEPREVAAWFEAPLALLLDRANWTERSAMWKGQERRYLDMDFQGFRIWGVTAAILANLALRIDFDSIHAQSRSS